MSMSNYPNGFAGGFTIRGIPLAMSHPGNVFWVDSGAGGNGNPGTFQRPFATLDYAIGRCTASNGDIIFIKPGHSETITGAAGIAADVAGIAIIGLGVGTMRPTFLMDGGTSVTFAISAANVYVGNCLFKAGHADVVTCFNVTAVSAHIDRCEFINNVVDENFVTEIKATGAANTADGLTVTNCRVNTVDAAGAEFIELTDDIDSMVVKDNVVIKDAGTAAKLILCATGKDLTGVVVDGNILVSGMTAGDILIDNDTAVNTGVVCRNLVGHHDTAAVIIVDADGVRQFNNYSVGSDTESGVLMPAADTLT